MSPIRSSDGDCARHPSSPLEWPKSPARTSSAGWLIFHIGSIERADLCVRPRKCAGSSLGESEIQTRKFCRRVEKENRGSRPETGPVLEGVSLATFTAGCPGRLPALLRSTTIRGSFTTSVKISGRPKTSDSNGLTKPVPSVFVRYSSVSSSVFDFASGGPCAATQDATRIAAISEPDLLIPVHPFSLTRVVSPHILRQQAGFISWGGAPTAAANPQFCARARNGESQNTYGRDCSAISSPPWGIDGRAGSASSLGGGVRRRAAERGRS